jgi:PEP-CTERM motif
MKKINLTSILAAVMALTISCTVAAQTIDVLYTNPLFDIWIIEDGIDQAPGTLADPTDLAGPVIGGFAPLGPLPDWSIVEWVNAAHPTSPANQWNTVNSGNPVSGGTYDGSLEHGQSLFENGSSTADALWIEIGDVATSSTSVPSQYVAFVLKADDNDGIADFYVNNILMATIDLYHNQDDDYYINRDITADPDPILGDYWRPVCIVIDMAPLLQPQTDELATTQYNNIKLDTFDLKVDVIAQSETAPSYQDDVEILGAAALIIVPEPGTMTFIAMGALALFRRRKA